MVRSEDERDVAEQVTDEARDAGESTARKIKSKAEDVVDEVKKKIKYSSKLRRENSNYSKKLHAKGKSSTANSEASGGTGTKASATTNARSSYASKLHSSKHVAKDGAKGAAKASKEAAKKMQKKQIQKAAQNSAKAAGRAAAEGAKATATAVQTSSTATTAAASSNPYTGIALLIIMAVILVIIALFMWLIVSTLATYTTAITSTFTSKDEDILAVEAMYKDKERALRTRLDNIESEMPGYDEYRYNLDEIGHNPFELASILTVMYEAYKSNDPRVISTLGVIFDKQYVITFTESVETRSRQVSGSYTVDGVTYSYSYTEYYDVTILTTTMKNTALSIVKNQMYLTEDQLKRYAVLIETNGNKAYLFEDDVNAIGRRDVPDYDIPPEYLTDEAFARMITEAEKYLGYPYVWGGSTPETSFDCSGFVSWVINHSGNGWNVGRSTANGLTGYTTPIRKEDAKPGDLIFFQGTYNTSGASHVGIYVGDGMMIHCGNPIQYGSIETPYWVEHFYMFGRLPSNN